MSKKKRRVNQRLGTKVNLLGIFGQKYKVYFMGCFVSLANDGILKCFALNAKISRAELNQCD